MEIRTTTLYALGALITILSLVAGMGIAWGALNSSINTHHANKAMHLTEGDVKIIAPSRGEYEATLKRIDQSLATIDSRLNRIEDKVYGR